MGTRCGPQYVDIQVVALPGPRSAFADNFGAISLRRAQRDRRRRRRRATRSILADGLSGGSQEYGLGETIMGSSGEQPGTRQRPQPRRADLGPVQPRRRRRARHRPLGLVAGGLPARGRRTTSAPSSGARRTRRSRSARRCPQYGHCFQGADVMCYVEDGGAAHARCSHRLRRVCPARSRRTTTAAATTTSTRPRRPAPTWRRTGTPTTPRSWRRAARSPRPAAAANLWVPEPPAAHRRPRRSPAAARRGSTLTARAGTWSNGPTDYTYQWQRLTAAGWENIEGETAAHLRGRPARISGAACGSR